MLLLMVPLSLNRNRGAALRSHAMRHGKVREGHHCGCACRLGWVVAPGWRDTAKKDVAERTSGPGDAAGTMIAASMVPRGSIIGGESTHATRKLSCKEVQRVTSYARLFSREENLRRVDCSLVPRTLLACWTPCISAPPSIAARTAHQHGSQLCNTDRKPDLNSSQGEPEPATTLLYRMTSPKKQSLPLAVVASIDSGRFSGKDTTEHPF